MRKIFQLINNNLSFLTFKSAKARPPKQLPIITISREMGSGGRLIAFAVAKKMGKKWRVYHKDIIDKIAKKTHLEKALIKEIDEKRISLVDELIGDIFGKRYPALSIYYRNLIKVLSEIGQRGYAVVVGRGADYLFPHALKVRTICPMQQRVKWEMEYEKLSKQQAIERIRHSDESRNSFIKALYKHDPQKPHHYDLTIRTSLRLGVEDAADLIVRAAKRRFKI